LAISLATPQWISEVENSYQNDPHCQKLLEQLLVTATHAVNNNSLQHGIIRHKGKIYVGRDPDLRKRIMQALHSSALGGHSGMKASYKRLNQVFYWPGMKKDLDNFVLLCPVCQKNKGENCPYPGFLDPLHIPDMVWTHISMDFIEGLPKSNGKEVIFVVVDRLSKFAHFIPLSHPYTVQTVARAFIDNVMKLHGPPLAIVSDRDCIFTSKLWQDIFAALGIELRYSSAYHPQSDGQTERVNQCIENYLRCMTSLEPKKWVLHLSMAEYWYNTSFHSSLQKTPFQAMYGYPPPDLQLPAALATTNTEATEFLGDRNVMWQQLKSNLANAQARMKKYADLKRVERQLSVGDMVYLKMQPYRLNAFGARSHIKLQSKFYGPFRVIAKVGNVAYKLLLPDSAAIHPVFHVSQLKKHLGPMAVPCADLPLIGPDGRVRTKPSWVLETRQIPRNNVAVVQWLVQWENLPPEDASWEDADFMKKVFPAFFKQTVDRWFNRQAP
jgi:transposase InsO family protein